MKYLIGLTDKYYHLWQMIVQINNFRRLGIESDVVYVISYNKNKSKYLNTILNDNSLKCKIYCYPEIYNNRYSVSRRAMVFEQHFDKYPEMEKETLFMIDPDVLFIQPIDFTHMLEDDIWYGSNVKNYIGHKYIKSRSELLYKEMCDIVGINPSIPEKYENDTIGAQILMKNVPKQYWIDCRNDMEALYLHMKSTLNKYKNKEGKSIQHWTADMWSLLWNIWKMGVITKIDKSLDFIWATHSMQSIGDKLIYHNAGKVKQSENKFAKLSYTKQSPFYKNLNISKESASSFYYNEILQTEKNFPLLTRMFS